MTTAKPAPGAAPPNRSCKNLCSFLTKALLPLGIVFSLETRALSRQEFDQDPGVQPHVDRRETPGGLAQGGKRRQPLL